MNQLALLKSRADLRAYTASLQGKGLGFVPTMGALHAGHVSLVRRAAAENAAVLVSVFVNPTQFGPNDDFNKYPRNLDADIAMLAGSGATAVFSPDVETMYPEGATTTVHVGALTEGLCGPFRPGHFEGVATVVAKFFGAVGPCNAYFGRKDYQQLAVIQRMVADLFMPVNVVGVPTMRDPDGLAMSSRNAYLSAEERARALGISRGLRAAHAAFAGGERSAAVLRALVLASVQPVATSIDYVTVCDAETLQEFAQNTTDRALLAVAIRVGSTRLIDNVVLGVDPTP